MLGMILSCIVVLGVLAAIVGTLINELFLGG